MRFMQKMMLQNICLIWSRDLCLCRPPFLTEETTVGLVGLSCEVSWFGMEFEALELLNWIVEQVEDFENGSLDSFLPNITDYDNIQQDTASREEETGAKVDHIYLVYDIDTNI